MEQYEFNFNEQVSTTPEEMTRAELADEYKKLVGVGPRTNDRDVLIKAINSPSEEYDRLRKEDAESDKEDIRDTYRGG